MKQTCLLFLSLLIITPFTRAASIEFEGNSLLSSSDLNAVKIRLSEANGKLVPDKDGALYALGQLETTRLAPEAVAQIVRDISLFYQSRDILATRAEVTREAFETSRQGGNLKVRIIEGQIGKIGVATSDGSQLHKSTQERVMATSLAEVGGPLDRSDLDHSILSMNRFAVDQVQPVLFSSPEGIVLEYRINAGKRGSLEYSVDNFGSERTGDVRHAVSLSSTGIFTENDRASATAMLTSGSHSKYVRGEYFLPVGQTLQHRWSVSAYYSAYEAENIGVTAFDFEGKTNGVLVAYQHTLWSGNRRFVDLSLGVHFLDASQDQSSVGVPSSSSSFLLPFVDLKVSQHRGALSWVAGIRMEVNLPDLGNTGNSLELARLGRINVVDDFKVVRFYGGLKAFLDPSRRAHEILANGQYEVSLGGDRVPAQFLNIVGGHNTVRGYRVAILSGDNSAYGQLEYRLHLLSLMREKSIWDIALGAFVDAGTVENEEALPFEIDDTISSYGFGLHLEFNSRFKASVEYARAAMDLNTPYDSVDSGDDEVYLKASLQF